MGESVGGDQITGTVGDAAKNVVVGNHNRQTVNESANNSRQVNEITINETPADTQAMWRAIANLDMRLTILENNQRNNARQYWFAIALFVVVIVSLWYLSMKIDGYTKAAQNLSRLATEQRK